MIMLEKCLDMQMMNAYTKFVFVPIKETAYVVESIKDMLSLTHTSIQHM